MAKEILKSYREGGQPHKYRTDLWWTVVLTVASLGWELLKETIMQPYPIARVLIGWLLWMFAYVSLARLFVVHWSRDREWRTLVRIALVIFGGLGLASLAFLSISIEDARKPTYLMVKPGLIFQDGATRNYYYAAKHQPLHNATIIVWDDVDARNTMTLKESELDVCTSGFAEYFLFKPTSLGTKGSPSWCSLEMGTPTKNWQLKLVGLESSHRFRQW